MDSLKCQTSTATPAEPGGLLVLLGGLPGAPPGQALAWDVASGSLLVTVDNAVIKLTP